MISIRDRRSNLLGFGQLLRQQPKQSTQSVVYQASRGQFIKYQEISTYGAVDFTSFEYKGHTYLAVANYYHQKYNINSALNKWV